MIDKNEYDVVNPQDFEFVQKDEKIYDKKFETKPVGYFKDAMIRFSKNKTNVVATFILFTLILLAILVPILTTKNYTKLEPELSYLPPRIPIIEKLGIFDGTRKFTQQTVDLETIDPDTGLGLPLDFDPDLIIMDSLENNLARCTERIDVCIGGQNDLTLKDSSNSAGIISSTWFDFDVDNDSVLKIDVNSISDDNPSLDVLISKDYGYNYVVIGTITEAGVHEFDVFEILGTNLDFTSQVQLVLSGDNGTKTSVSLNSVEVYDNSQTEPVYSESGLVLSNYTLLDDGGFYARSNGTLRQASFRYKAYDAAFGDREEHAFPDYKYNALIAENGDKCVQSPDPYNPDGWIFSKGCPVKRVIGLTEGTAGPNGEMYYSYNLILDYAIYRGYESVPYFLFGTTAAGHDYFALLWLGLRTSLTIGLIVAIINISVGIVYGSIEGYYGGRVDLLMERFGEIIGRIPWLVWLGLFVIILGPGPLTLIVLMTITGWLGVAGVTRTQFYRYKGREYVLASRTLGAKDSRLIFRHILPNGIGTIITASILMIPGVIFTESTVSYLGYGIGHGQSLMIFGLFDLSGVSIGVLLADGRTQLVDKPYLTLFPSIIISILMITFNMFGNALRDAFNPSLRGSE